MIIDASKESASNCASRNLEVSEWMGIILLSESPPMLVILKTVAERNKTIGLQIESAILLPPRLSSGEPE